MNNTVEIKCPYCGCIQVRTINKSIVNELGGVVIFCDENSGCEQRFVVDYQIQVSAKTVKLDGNITYVKPNIKETVLLAEAKGPESEFQWELNAKLNPEGVITVFWSEIQCESKDFKFVHINQAAKLFYELLQELPVELTFDDFDTYITILEDLQKNI